MDAMGDNTTDATEVRVKPARKGKGKPPVVAKGKRSLNLSLPVEDYERLAIHALRQDCTLSDLVSQLAREHLRDYHLTRTPGGRPDPNAV
jgi:hypothetical protein